MPRRACGALIVNFLRRHLRDSVTDQGRLVARLREELGDDLLAVWLYGSRARGEADPSETDPDRRSDVDLMAIVDPARDAAGVSWEFAPILENVVDAEGAADFIAAVEEMLEPADNTEA
jgi:predicted nucleotidyltransferase